LLSLLAVPDYWSLIADVGHGHGHGTEPDAKAVNLKLPDKAGEPPAL
jgi:hypothetical protein